MNTLLRIYLVLIFTGSTSSAGLENDSINSGFPIEAYEFSANPSYQQNLKMMDDCINSGVEKDYEIKNGAFAGKASE